MKTLLVYLCCGWSAIGLTQTHAVQGTVHDLNHEPVPGAYLHAGGQMLTATDPGGRFQFTLPAGIHQIEYSAVGHATGSLTLHLQSDTVLQLLLREISKELDVVVVSGSLYEKNITDETGTIEVVKSSLLKNNNVVSLTDGVQKVPGVYLLDNQINIRGGTGFTYGAGSRVMVVLDDLPLLNSDRGDVSNHFLPMELVDQMEVMKGAASVLYGSSALNGVVSLRTVWPGEETKTHITLFQGIFDKPQEPFMQWWGAAPIQTGGQITHQQKFKYVDVVLSGVAMHQESNLEGQFGNRARFTWKTRYRPAHNDRISLGINGNVMSDDQGIFFLFADADTGIYRAFGGPYDSTLTTLLNWKYRLLSIDPWMNLFDQHGGKHRFRMRYYQTGVSYSDTTGGLSWMQHADYQYNRTFRESFVLTAGIQGYYFHVDDDQLLQHSGFSGGAYVQADQKLFNRLNLNVGFREEFFLMDTLDFIAVPIFKAGASLRVWPQTFLRTSFGQGFRVPSLPERYAKTNLGVLAIFPNPDITPEYGWNAELAVKKTFTGGTFRGYTDLAFYVTDYFNMTEFIFDFYLGEGLGFKSLNTGRARLAGMEFTAAGAGTLFGHTYSLVGGYNYLYPADLSTDSSQYNWSNFLSNAVQGFNNTDSAFVSHILKYRFRHLLRLDAEYQPGKWTTGVVVNYYSYMENIDYVFETFGIPEGLSDFRAQHTRGDWIWDARVGYQVQERFKVMLLVRNLTNHVYAIRPGRTEWNRHFILQTTLQL